MLFSHFLGIADYFNQFNCVTARARLQVCGAADLLPYLIFQWKNTLRHLIKMSLFFFCECVCEMTILEFFIFSFFLLCLLMLTSLPQIPLTIRHNVRLMAFKEEGLRPIKI